MLRPDDFLKGQLVLYGWRQGKEFGGHLASESIMSVIANRVKAGWGSWMDVIADAPNKAATLEQPQGVPQTWSPEFSKLLHSVESIYEGSAKDMSNGAMYFADLSRPISNPWFQDKILDHLDIHRMVGSMNSLSFFI